VLKWQEILLPSWICSLSIKIAKPKPSRSLRTPRRNRYQHQVTVASSTCVFFLHPSGAKRVLPLPTPPAKGAQPPPNSAEKQQRLSLSTPQQRPTSMPPHELKNSIEKQLENFQNAVAVAAREIHARTPDSQWEKAKQDLQLAWSRLQL